MTGAPLVRIGPAHGAAPRAYRIGVPLPRGWLAEGAPVAGCDAATGAPVPLQSRALARWPDRSVKWLLVDAAPGPGPGGAARAVELVRAGAPDGAAPMRTARQVEALVVDAGACTVAFDVRGDRLVASVRDAGGAERLASDGIRLRVAGAAVAVLDARVEESGPLRTLVVQHGTITSPLPRPLEFVARWTLTAGEAAVLLELRLRNPNPALHPGGLWDLGDPGSVLIGDLSIEAAPSAAPERVAWRTAPEAAEAGAPAADWALYQDSSGGERWDAPNHVEADGTSGVAFRGWRASGPGGET
ncbi:MAG: hypothetical protein ACK54X_15360, partial [Burkholderiales bacterium]